MNNEILYCAAGAVVLALLITIILVRAFRKPDLRSRNDARERMGSNRFVVSEESESPDGVGFRRKVLINGKVTWSNSAEGKAHHKHLVAEINAGRLTDDVAEQLEALDPGIMQRYRNVMTQRQRAKDAAAAVAAARAADIARISPAERARRIDAAKQAVREQGQRADAKRAEMKDMPHAVRYEGKHPGLSAPYGHTPAPSLTPAPDPYFDNPILNPIHPLHSAFTPPCPAPSYDPPSPCPSPNYDSGSSCDSGSSSSSCD